MADGAAPVLVAAYEDRRWPASLRQEVFLFLCRMHKDTPPRMVDELYVIAEKRGRLNREERDALAYAVGDCSEEWQRFVLDRILRCRFADWTWMLSVALWRSEVPVSYVSIDHMAEVLPQLFDSLRDKVDRARTGDFRRGIEPVLEVCLALLRLRGTADESLAAVLAPTSEYGLAFTELIDELTNLVVAHGHQLRTRVALQVDKTAEYGRVPDLLYALRLYLTGDDGADAVRVSEVTWG